MGHRGALLLVASVVLTACGTINQALADRRETVEYYRIYDIHTRVDRDDVADAASRGLRKNVNATRESRPIPPFAEPPDRPGRFTVVNPLEGTPLGRLAAAQGGQVALRMATCIGAVWEASAVRDVPGGSHLRLTACLFQYREGFHLDVHAIFEKVSGGARLDRQLGRAMAYAVVGTPEQWTEKTFVDMVREIRNATHAEIALVEGYPKSVGTPWLDAGEAIPQAAGERPR